MKRSWTVALFRHEQPDEDAWQEVQRLVADWNQRETPKFEAVMDFMWQITFGSDDRRKVDVLRGLVREAERAAGVTHHYSWRDRLEEDDYARADFVGLLGCEPDTTVLFLVNEDAAFAAAPPCPRCGAWSPYTVEQTAPLVIDPGKLAQSVAEAPASEGRACDLVSLGNGHNLISRRLAAILTDNDVTGHELRPVIDSTTGDPSAEIVQLLAAKAVISPCMEHTRIDGDPFCPLCGTAYGMLEGYFWVRDSWTGTDEVMSRHPGKAAMLHVSRRVYDMVRDAELNGIRRGGVFMICRHG